MFASLWGALGNLRTGMLHRDRKSRKLPADRRRILGRSRRGFEPLEDRLLLAIDPLGGEFRVNTSTTGDQNAVSVDANASGDYVAVWQSQHLEKWTDHDVFMQRYNAQGTPLGPEVRANTDWLGDQTSPDVAVADDGTFVVTWATSDDGSGWGIQAQRFDADGSPMGDVIWVNTYTESDQVDPEVAIDKQDTDGAGPDDMGDFVIVWTGASRPGQDESGNGVYGRRFDADGTPQGDEFLVNSHTEYDQQDPTVAMDAAGNFVVAWASAGQDYGYTWGIFARRYAEDGTPQGDVIPVNTTFSKEQQAPAAAMSAAGDFLIAWQSDHTGNYDVYAQRYHADGSKVGPDEFRVNTTTGNTQSEPAVAMDAAGNSLVAWQSYEQDGSRWGVYARRYAADGTADPTGEFQVNTRWDNSQADPAAALSSRDDFFVAFCDYLYKSVYGQFYGEGLPQPDLVPVKTSAPSGVNLGQTIEVSAVIRNQGDVDAAPFSFRYYLSPDPIITAEDAAVGGLINVEGLNRGSSHTDSRQLQVPLDAPTGSLYLGVLADVNEDVSEQDETNNGTATVGFSPIDVRQAPLLLGGEFLVNSYTGGNQENVSLDADAAGNYVAVWEGPNERAWGTTDIFLQRYNAEGTPLGRQQQVNPDWHADQTSPDVAVADDGTFVVTWATGDDGSGWGIQAQRFDADGSPAGDLIWVNTYTGGDQVDPEVAIDKRDTDGAGADELGDFVIVWTGASQAGQDESDTGVYGRRYHADGTPQGDEFLVNSHTDSSQRDPTVAMDAGGSFVVAWESPHYYSWDIFAQRYSQDGMPQGSEFRVNMSVADDQQHPALATDAAGNFVVTWQSHHADLWDVYAQRYATDGTALGEEFRVNTYTTSEQCRAAVAMDPSGNFIVAWDSSGQDGSHVGVYAQRYSAEGTPTGGEWRVNTTTYLSQSCPAVATGAGGDFLVAFTNQNGADLCGQLYGEGPAQPDLVPYLVSAPAGANLCQTITVSAEIRNQGGSEAGWFTSQYYLSADPVITTEDTPLGSPLDVNSLAAHGSHTDVQTFALPDVEPGDWYVGIVVDTSGSVAEADEGNNEYRPGFNEPTVDVAALPIFGPQERANTTTQEDQSAPAVDFDGDGNYVVVWQDELADGSGYGIFGQRFDGTGSPAGEEFQVNVTTGGDQKAPSVAMASDGRFVVTWHANGQDGSGWGVYARMFNSDGSPAGDEFRVNTHTASSQQSPVVAIDKIKLDEDDPFGGFVIVWQSYGQDPSSNWGIYGQRYHADGTPDGAEFWVCSTAPTDQQRPSVAMNGAGQFVVAWDDYDFRGQTTIYARRFLADGTAAGDEFKVNTYSAAGERRCPRVAMDTAGNFVVVWESMNQDGYSWGVYAQRYAADGTPLGEESQVNTYTDDIQHLPTASMDAASGEYLVAWASRVQDGSDYGIFAQRFAADGTPSGGEFRVNLYTASAQTSPAVAMLDTQHFAIAWQSSGQDGWDHGIYTQICGTGGENNHPNLQVSALSAPGDVQLDETIGLALSVKNAGLTVAPASTARLWLSDDDVFGNEDDWDTGAQVNVPEIFHDSWNNTHQTTVPYTLPSTDPLGTDRRYYFIVEADSVEGIVESDETDNAGASNRFNLRMPDLTGTVSVPPSVEPGDPMPLSVTVWNQGDGTASASFAHLWLSDDDVIGNADDIDLVIEFTVPALGLNGTYPHTVDYTWPVVDPYDTDRQYYFVLKVDVDEEVEEINENNNADLSNSFGVSLPNLVVDHLTAPSEVDPGQEITVSVEVRNTGTADAGPSTLRLWLSDDATGGNGDEYDLSIEVPVPGLTPYGSPSYDKFATDVTLTWPDQDPFGTDLQYHVVAEADTAGAVEEGNEEDNWGASGAILLRVPDLEPVRLRTPSTVQAGQQLAAHLEVRNAGLLTAPASTAHVWLSDDAELNDPGDVELVPPLDVSIPELAGYESWESDLTIPWPDDDPFGTDGEYFVLIQLDYPGQVEEGNESNNLIASNPLALVTPMPLDIQLAGHLGGASHAAAIQGDYVYELTGAGLRVLDVSDPAAVMKLSEVVFPVSQAIAVSVEGDRLYEVDGQAVRVFDVSTPHQPTLLAEHTLYQDAPTAVAFEGSVLLIGDGAGSQLDVLDLSDPNSPAVLAEYDVRGVIRGIAVEGSTAYLSYYDGSFETAAIEVVDVASLSNPSFVSRRSVNFTSPGPIAASGGLLAIVEDDSIAQGAEPVVLLVDATDPASPRVRGQYVPTGEVAAVDLSGHLLQVVSREPDQRQKLVVVDVSDPADPAKIGVVDLGLGGGTTAASVGTLTYVASEALSVVDVSDPFNPTVLDSYAEPFGLGNIAMAGSVACMTSGSQLELIDVSEPALPRHLASYAASTQIDMVAAGGGYAVLAQGVGWYYGGQLEIVDVSNPADPVHAATHAVADQSYILDLAMEGHVLYVLIGGDYDSDARGTLLVFDVSDPTSLATLSAVDLMLDCEPLSDTEFLHAQLSVAEDLLLVSNTLRLDPEPNETLETATSLGDLGSPVLTGGAVGGPGDTYDWYKLTASAGDRLSAELRGTTEGAGTFRRGYLRLYDSSGSQLAYRYYSYGGGLIDGFELAADGDYYLRVESYYTSTNLYSYELAVALNEAPPPSEPFVGIRAYDVSDPAAPSFLGAANVAEPMTSISCDGSHGYVTLTDPALIEVWDFTDPANPVRGGTAQIGQAGPILVSGSLALIAAGSRMQVVDVHDPQYPVALESYEVGSEVSGFAAEGVVTFMAADSLYAFSVQPEGVEAPDLAVTSLSTDPAVELGTPLSVAWIVRNHGRFPADGVWTDRVYLSADAVWDTADVSLGHVDHTGPLEPLDSYEGQLSPTVAGVAPGTYYVIVRADADEDVNEWSVEANNTRVSARPIYVGYPDLDVTRLSLPPIADRGDLLPVGWIVYNRDFAPAGGSWTDEVYLSEDDTFDPGVDGPPVGTLEHPDGLDARTSYTASLDVDTSSFPGQSYYVIVKTDSGSKVFEDGREANNLLVSDRPLRLGIPALSAGEPLAGGFDFVGQSRYYQIEVGAGEHLHVALDDLNDLGCNELYVKYGSVPTRADYDARYSANLAPDQVVEIPHTQAGKYYILAYCAFASEFDADPPDAAEFNLTASILDLEVLGLSPNYGGNVGNVTVRIRGANLADDLVTQLISPDGESYYGTGLYLVDGSELYATFDLEGAAPGTYDFRAQHYGGPPVEVPDIFQVRQGTGPSLEANLLLPDSVRRLQSFKFDVEYANTGDTDMPSPFLNVTSPDGLPLGLDLDAADGVGSLRFVGYSRTGPAGILQPGDHERITIYSADMNLPISAHVFQLSSQSVDPLNPSRELIDWDTLESQYRPPFAEDESWDAIWKTFTREIGATWDEVIMTLARRVTETVREGTPMILVKDLMNEQLLLAMERGGGLTDGQPPRILHHTAYRAPLGGVDLVGLTFSESINPDTFTPDDVAIVDPAGQPVTPVTVTQHTGRVYTVGFPAQTARGTYHVYVGPHVEDLVALEMDQDDDGVAGEAEEDRYDAMFAIDLGGEHALRNFVTFHTPSGEIDEQEGIDHVVVHFSKPIFSDTFGPGDVTLTGPGGAVPILGVRRLSATSYRVDFPRQDEVGTYTLSVGPHILDLDRRFLDQDRDGNDGEPGEDVYSGTFEIVDTYGPRIIGHSPDGFWRVELFGPVNEIEVFFNEPIQPETFHRTDVHIVGPDGAPIAVTDVRAETDTMFVITIPDQSVPGEYTLTIGPDIRDQSGNRMNQNRDRTNGGAGDAYVGTFDILPGALSVMGRVTYAGEFARFFPNGAHVAVQLWERNGAVDFLPGRPAGDPDDERISRTQYTSDTGHYRFIHDQAGFPIENVEPNRVPALEGEDGTTRDPYVLVLAENEFAFVVELVNLGAPPAGNPLATNMNPGGLPARTAPSWGTLYAIPTLAAGNLPPGPQDVVLNLAININLNVNIVALGDAFWLCEWIRYAANWVQARVPHVPPAPAPPRRIIGVQYPGRDNDQAEFVSPLSPPARPPDHAADYIWVGRELVGIPGAVIHEYGHSIEFALNNYLDPPYFGDFYSMIQESTHETMAYSEAWASFFAAIVTDGLPVPKDALEQIRTTGLESNNYWMGWDAYGFPSNALGHDLLVWTFLNLPIGGAGRNLEDLFESDAVNDNGNSGAVVMGGIMSIFWDLADDSPGEDGVNSFLALWNTVDAASSFARICSAPRGPRAPVPPPGTCFWDASPRTNAWATIFIDHGVAVVDDTLEQNGAVQNDRRANATNLAVFDNHGLIMAEEGQRNADWFTFGLPTFPNALRDTYNVTVTITFDPRYGDLDLAVWNNTTGDRAHLVHRGGRSASVTFADLSTNRPYQFDVCVAGHGVLSDAGAETNRGGDYHPNYRLSITGPPFEVPHREREEDEGSSRILGAWDPNDKTGPAGAGDAGYVLPGTLMPYSIYYENDPEKATAPAQVVRVEDQLDDDLDWSTFELGDINLFGDCVVSVPAGLNHFETTVDLRPEGMDLLVHVTAGLDAETGVAQWLFESLDPESLEAPDDPLAGFLAVNDKDLHNGEGHFDYYVRAKSDLASGTQIINQAFNYFDQNEPVATPSTLNTIDAGPPTSSVNALSDEVPDEPLLISWGGQDDPGGSGIETYTIYVSTDSGPWEVWLEDTYHTSAYFHGVGGHGYAFRSVATDYVGHVEDDPGVAEASTTFDFSQLRVDLLETTPSGFVAHFKRALDASVLSLYDVEAGTFGPADLTVVGDTVGPVAGSLFYNEEAKTVTFIKTGGPLVPDTYTVTLRSAADGFKDGEGHLLDGDGDDVEGGDYVTTVVVEPAAARVVSLPDFTRGPGQPVDVPATRSGWPISIDEGAGVEAVDLTLTYDPELLSITGAAAGADAPSGSGVVGNFGTPGQVVLTFYSPTALGSGPAEIIVLTAEVPSLATYGASQIVHVARVEINEGQLPAAGDDAAHAAAFFGDTTANQAYSGLDAQRTARVSVGLDTGFAAYPTIDPVLIADVTGNGALSGLDATRIAQEAVGLDPEEIPPLPGSGAYLMPGKPAAESSTMPAAGALDQSPPPALSAPALAEVSAKSTSGTSVEIPRDLTGTPAETVTAPVNVAEADGVESVDLRIVTDAGLLETLAVDAGSVWPDTNTTVVVNLDQATGSIIATAYHPVALGPGAGSLLDIDFRIAPEAEPGGTAVIDLQRLDLNEDLIPVDPDPVVGDDPTDGLITILGLSFPGQFDVVLVFDPTPLEEGTGEANTLRESKTWIDEWSSFWVEIWLSTPGSDQSGIETASVDLAYNTELFTATSIEAGPAFTGSLTGTIDDSAGLVDDVDGATSRTDVGDDKYALFARVRFELTASDQGCLHNATGQYITAVGDLGFALVDDEVHLVETGAADVQIGELPATEDWPVMYDIDDDGRIGFGDLAFFATAFQQQVGDPGADFAWACDFDHSERVDVGDLAFFAENFQRAAGDPIVYPANFPDDWQNGTQGAAALAELAAAENLRAADPASLYDSALEACSDPAQADRSPAQLSKDALAYACWAMGFDRMQTASSDSSNTEDAAEAVDFLVTHGYW